MAAVDKGKSPFLAAIRVLEDSGWQQQGYAPDEDADPTESNGPFCIAGALAKALRLRSFASVWGRETDLLIDLASRDDELPIGEDAIAVWNDRAERSVEDVILLLKRAHEAWVERPA